jgi:energy-coupling factor transport system permease protein
LKVNTLKQNTSIHHHSAFSLQPLAFSLRFNSVVWLVWLAAAMLAVSSNPLLNLLVLAQAVLVALASRTDKPVSRAFGIFAWLAVVLVVVRTLLSAVPVGGITYGATPLFTLPTIQLPIWLGGLNIGGVATLEMIAGGFVQGLKLATLVLVFAAFNAVADHYALLRHTPRALFHAGLVVNIALTFVPHVVLQLQAIRDAQRVRGHRFRTMRDALPLLVPLLAGGLERSLQLAEAMDSRGYARTLTPRRNRIWTQVITVGGLTLLGVGLFFLFTGDGRGLLASGAGVIITAGALRTMGSGAPRTRYRRERWHRRDTLVVVACGVLIGGTLALRATGNGGLVYTTLPHFTLPPFDPIAGMLLLLLGTPALIPVLATKEPHERLHHRTVARGRERRTVERADLSRAAQPEPLGEQRAHR